MKNHEWISRLIKQVFEKAEKESGQQTAYGLSKFLNEEKGMNISERNLIRYYNFYVEGRQKDRVRPDGESLELLSNYLDYKNFRDFVNKRSEERRQREAESGKALSKMKNRLLISGIGNGMLVLALLFFVLKYYKKSCMIWVGDHYEKIRCSGLENEKKLDKVVLLRMREIKDPMQCQHEMWYDKSDNQVRFFSYYGQHPTNGKTLKRVTEHICERYILEKRDSVLAQNGTTVLDSLE
ncbi:MAG: hypothetical protein AAF717_16010 [Bacteroidota bacterium]